MRCGKPISILLAWAATSWMSAGCAEPEHPAGRVILIGIDGASLPLLRELSARQQLPSFTRLVHEGAVGPLASLPRTLPFSPQRGVGWWSPVVWTSIATGKTPEVHGIVDFRLPNPETVELCTVAGSSEAQLTLAATAQAAALRIRPSAAAAATGWVVKVAGEGTGTPIEAPLDLPLPETAPDDSLEIRFLNAKREPKPLCLNTLRLVDERGLIVRQLHFLSDRAWFPAGWDEPRFGRLHGASPRHRAVEALWNIAGNHQRKVALVSWRDSWPAEAVNGYAVSDRLGRRFASRRDPVPLDPRQYHPESMRTLVEPYLARTAEVDALAAGTLLDGGACEVPDAKVARVQHWSDWLAHQLALRLWDDDPEIDFLAVYYSGPDAFGHVYMPRREQRDLPCRIEPPLVDRYYALVDDYLADWWARLEDDVSLVIVSGHGMQGGELKGEHADNGFAALAGRGVAAGATLKDADVLDVAPLVLYLLGLPLAADMPGEPPWSGLDREQLRREPPRRVPTHESRTQRPEFVEPPKAFEAELLERLRTLGWLD
ncbi:MAG: alkaline phosphatase family protein [Deltaproteobacteria bacterium]|nr:alkaline phosphatase family protein [Deltaproteobacteria bacterium]